MVSSFLSATVGSLLEEEEEEEGRGEGEIERREVEVAEEESLRIFLEEQTIALSSFRPPSTPGTYFLIFFMVFSQENMHLNQ